MATFEFTIKGTIIDAPDEQQALNFLRIRLRQGISPSGQDRVTFAAMSDVDVERIG